MRNIFEKVLRAGEGRRLKALEGRVQDSNDLEDEVKALSDDEIRARMRALADEVRSEIEDGGGTLDNAAVSLMEQEEAEESASVVQRALDAVLPEAFALTREASRRHLGMRHFDVQLMGGIVLHEKGIAEMKTGEGKTLVATLPAALNALTGRGVHIVTVNDYLARRDCGWNAPLYHALGLTVGAIANDLSVVFDPDYDDGHSTDERLRHLKPVTRAEAYQADIVHGTSSEFGFDYLRDNMAVSRDEQTQRGHYFAIVDEVDSILIDEARTPLIISGPAESRYKMYQQVNKAVSGLKGITVAKEDKEAEAEYEEQYDYITNEKERVVKETARGQKRVAAALNMDAVKLFGQEEGDGDGEEPQLSLAEAEEVQRYRLACKQSMTAHSLYQRDRDYVIKDGEVIIVDEFTGRLMFGRRYSEGLHEAIEAKEGVRIREESQTLATITLQNFFRMYEKLAGMTGTAATEANEFKHIYDLDTVVIPTNMPMVRDDENDIIYRTGEIKMKQLVEEIRARQDAGQPVLVGTISIEKNEKLSSLLTRHGVKHELLNAKAHEREAEIIAQAGRRGAVTVATNMAGRGVDIILGGNPPDEEEAEKVKEVGGLHVIGTERHESRRIDNQLRGRSGRQGDPGSTQFFLSLEDDLLRLFGPNMERIGRLMDRPGLEEEPIMAGMVTKTLERAQQHVESQNFEIRKHVLEYDDVMNKQREVIYRERAKVLAGESLHGQVEEFIADVVTAAVLMFCAGETYPENWDLDGLFRELREVYPVSFGPADVDLKTTTCDELTERVVEDALGAYRKHEETIGPEMLEELERMVMLQVIDTAWRDHLHEMDYLKDGIGLRAIGQRDPLVEYKTEAFDMFQGLIESIKDQFVRFIFHVRVVEETPMPRRMPMGEAVLAGVPGAFEAASQQMAAAAAFEGEEPMAVGAGGRGGRRDREMDAALEYSGQEAYDEGPRREPVRAEPKVGRNDPCPCGSGKKYKKCCGANA